MLVSPANENAVPALNPELVVVQALTASLDAHRRMLEHGGQAIVQIAQVLSDCLMRGGKVLFCGNGGSAADAQHAAAELVGRFYRDRRALSALSLTTDTSVLTAVGNDWQFEDVFARQVAGLGRPGDVIVGMSTSGRSKNIVQAFKMAHELEMHCVALTGEDGRDVAAHADYRLAVPSDTTPRIQELHILALHSICEVVEATLCEQESSLAGATR